MHGSETSQNGKYVESEIILKGHTVFYVYKVKLNCGLNTIPPTYFCSYVVFHIRLTSTTVASPGCSTNRDGLTAKGGCSEK